MSSEGQSSRDDYCDLWSVCLFKLRLQLQILETGLYRVAACRSDWLCCGHQAHVKSRGGSLVIVICLLLEVPFVFHQAPDTFLAPYKAYYNACRFHIRIDYPCVTCQQLYAWLHVGQGDAMLSPDLSIGQVDMGVHLVYMVDLIAWCCCVAHSGFICQS